MKSNPLTNSPLSSNSSPATHPDLSKHLALTIAQTADDRKGGDILLLDVAAVSYLADYFILITGFSKTQVRAIAQSIQATVEEQYNRQPLRVEGQADSTWIVQDYGDVIAHIMMPEEREFYDLEAFWGHAEPVPLPPESFEV